MTLAPPAISVDAPAPLLLLADLRLSPEQFEAVCAANPEAVLERCPDGHPMEMMPTGVDPGPRHQALGTVLALAVCDSGFLLRGFDSSSGCRCC